MSVSLNPDTFTKGGLFSDVDVEFLDFHYTLEAPEGYTTADRVFAKAELKILSDGSLVDAHYSAGQSSDFVPSKDGPVEGTGYTLEETGQRTTLNDNTNLGIFISEAVKCGFPKDKLQPGSLAVFKGLVAHVVRIPVKREGLESQKKEGARQQTVLVINKIIRMPGQAASRKKGAATASSSAPAAAPAEAGEVTDEVKAAVQEILAGGVISLKKLKTELLRRFMKSPNRAELIAAGTSEDTLLELEYVLDGEEISKA